MKIYLAGNIRSEGKWRDRIIESRETDLSPKEISRCQAGGHWPTRRKACFGRHHYMGPYAANLPDLDANLRAASILLSDVVFAWLGSECVSVEAIFEIGFAAGNSIPVVIGCERQESLDKAFLILLKAADFIEEDISAARALRTSLNRIAPDYNKTNHGNTWKSIPSQFDGNCCFCGGVTRVGTSICWRRTDRGSEAAHPECFVTRASRITAETTLKDASWNLLQEENRKLSRELEELKNGSSVEHRVGQVP